MVNPLLLHISAALYKTLTFLFKAHIELYLAEYREMQKNRQPNAYRRTAWPSAPARLGNRVPRGGPGQIGETHRDCA